MLRLVGHESNHSNVTAIVVVDLSFVKSEQWLFVEFAHEAEFAIKFEFKI